MKKNLLYLFIFLTGALSAQDGHKNVVKLNLSALALKTYSLQYERGLTKNISVAGGLRFTSNVGLPSKITSSDSTGSLKNFGMNGWAITPEFRYYPGKKEIKEAPRGFYLAPYLRYAHFSTSVPVSFTDTITNTAHIYEMKGNINALSYGLMIGAQWIIKDRVSIDWWILGGSTGSFKSTFEIAADLKAVPADKRADWEKNIKETGADLPGGWTIDGHVTDTGVSADIKGKLAGLRSGLCIGFAF
jgi:hypothetical protein